MSGGGCSCHLCFLPGGKGERCRKTLKKRDWRSTHPEEFLEMLSEVANDKRYKNAKEKLLKNEEENVTMCVIAEKLENRGIQKGIEQGIERGQVLLIKNLIEDG